MEAQLQELAQFLRLETRLDIKTIALDYVLGLTGSEEGRSAIFNHVSILKLLFDLTTDNVATVSHNAYLAILNLSGYDQFANKLININVIPKLIEILTGSTPINDADTVCMILSNTTRLDQGTESFMSSLGSAVTLYKMVDMFDKKDSKHGRPLHYLASVFSNVTKTLSARFMFLDKHVSILPRLLPYMHYNESLVRRGGIIGMVRNLCFETSHHDWLLNDPEIDLLSYLLLPLAGPEPFTDDENDSLPIDLQYLSDDKEREPDPDLRKMLLESLMKLCATINGRQYLHDKNAYVVLKAYDQWEQEELLKETCQNVISILIADEPEPGMENLDKVIIPPHITKKLEGTVETVTSAVKQEDSNGLDN